MNRLCQHCQNPLIGRIDKLFCDDNCRASHHYALKKGRRETLYTRIDKQLKVNRRLLKHFNHAGKSTIRVEKLLEAGFNPHYFTHYWKNQKGQVYLFCYDVGFLKLEEHGRRKYLIIDWQDYMAPG